MEIRFPSNAISLLSTPHSLCRLAANSLLDLSPACRLHHFHILHTIVFWDNNITAMWQATTACQHCSVVTIVPSSATSCIWQLFDFLVLLKNKEKMSTHSSAGILKWKTTFVCRLHLDSLYFQVANLPTIILNWREMTRNPLYYLL